MQLKLIQALRGLAALVVVIHHASGATNEYFNIELLNDVFSVGWSGVDFFFVLSGFIMVFIHYDDLKSQSNIKYFFLKRSVRIFPIYWFLASIALMFFMVSGKKLAAENWDYLYVIKSYLLLPQEKAPFLGVAWSLTFEVFFYLVFGIGLLFGFKIMKVILLLWSAGIILINIIGTNDLPYIVNFIFSGYIIEFLIGCVTGYLFHSYKFEGKNLFVLGVLIFIGMAYISFTTNFGSKAALESRFIYGIASSLIILGAAFIDSGKRIKINNIYLILGNASYVLYLIHPLVLAFVYKVFSKLLNVQQIFQGNYQVLSIAIALFATLLSVGLGILVHLFIELKIINYLNKILPAKRKSAQKLNSLITR